MKTVTVSPRAKTLHNLLRKARRNGLILQSPEGERFVLTPIGNWIGFDVGDSDDFAEEVKMTVRNKKLMKFLAKRRRHGVMLPHGGFPTDVAPGARAARSMERARAGGARHGARRAGLRVDQARGRA